MKKNKEFKDLGVGEKLKLSESLGAKVATILNKARGKCNLMLKPTGYGVNIKVEFYKLDVIHPEELKIEDSHNG